MGANAPSLPRLRGCSPILSTWNRVWIPSLACSPKTPTCNGILAKHDDESILQAGEIGLQHTGDLVSLLQAG